MMIPEGFHVIEENGERLVRPDVQNAYSGIPLSVCFCAWDGRQVSDELFKKLALQNCEAVQVGMFVKEAEDE
jgi:hypothetical protein